MNSETRLYRTWKTKSATRKALSVLWYSIYFFSSQPFTSWVQNQPMVSREGKSCSGIYLSRKYCPPETAAEKIMPRLHTPLRDLADVTTAESAPTLVSPVAVPTENPRPALGRSLQPDTQTAKPRQHLTYRKITGTMSAPLCRPFATLKGIYQKQKPQVRQAIPPLVRNVQDRREFSVHRKFRPSK